jgi:hypothetical protein
MLGIPGIVGTGSFAVSFKLQGNGVFTVLEYKRRIFLAMADKPAALRFCRAQIDLTGHVFSFLILPDPVALQNGNYGRRAFI